MTKRSTEIEGYDGDDDVVEVDPSAETIDATDPNGDPTFIRLTENQIRENQMEAGYVDGEPPEEVEAVPVDEDVDETV